MDKTFMRVDKELLKKLKAKKLAQRESYADVVKRMIDRELRSPKNAKSGCPNSYSNEHSFETFGMPKGKMKCVHCGIIKSMKTAR